MVADIEELGKLGRIRSPRSKTQRKGNINVQRWVQIHLPNRRRHGKIAWRDPEIRESIMRQCEPVGSEESQQRTSTDRTKRGR